MAAIKRPLMLLGAGVLLGWGTSSWVRWAYQQLLSIIFPFGPLKLERPLVAFDIESTGLNVSRDRVLEIAAVKLWPSGQVEVKGPQRLNPNMHIPAEVTAIHGITQEDLVHCPSFAQVAQEWRDFLEGCDLAGYNAKKFDVPILRNEFRRSGHFNFPPLGVAVVDAFRLFCQQEPRTLSAAVTFYCGRKHSKSDAHSALGDAWATLRVLVEQVRRYGDLPRSTTELAAMCSKPSRDQDITPDGKFQWRGDQPIVGFGKHSGEPLAVLIARHKDHLMWMSGQDWGDESLLLVAQALKGLLPTKAGGWEALSFEPTAAEAAAAAAAAEEAAAARQRRAQSNSSRGAQHMQHQHQGQPQQLEQQAGGSDSTAAEADSSGATQPPAAPQVVGWPTLDAAESAEQQQQHPDSWGVEPAAVVDGWSLLDTVSYTDNPGPQETATEPEEAEGGFDEGDPDVYEGDHELHSEAAAAGEAEAGDAAAGEAEAGQGAAGEEGA